MNPFDYQRPVDPSVLIDRRRELDMLQAAAADAVAIRLAAPRRFGKTSLLAAHLASMRAVGHRTVLIDLSQVTTAGDVAARTARAFSTLPGPGRRVFDGVLSRLGLKLGVAGLTVSVTGRSATRDPQRAQEILLELLDVPRLLHESDGDLTVVCFDEFQDLVSADGTLDGLLRSVIQHQGRAAAYVYAGSAPSLMRALFSERERPLYGQARPLELPPLPADETVTDILRIAADNDIRIEPDAVRQIVDIGAGHPQRTMLLAHHVAEFSTAGHLDPVDAALTAALTETADVHQTVWDNLQRAERAVLSALADGLAPTGAEAADQHATSRSTLQSALRRLVSAEHHVVSRDGHSVIVDPLFGIWLARRGVVDDATSSR